MSKNKFNLNGDIMYISREDWDIIAMATVREDYIDEIKSTTWRLKQGRYPYSDKFGSLHSYIMKKWYGDNLCIKMKDEGYVIDHMDNVSHNCCIDNLCFLANSVNKAKGLTFDQKNKEKEYISLSLTKDFHSGLFQMTIIFNYPAIANISCLDKPAVIEEARFLYASDYEILLNDAYGVLLDYYSSHSFAPEKLRAIDYYIEGCYGQAVPVEVYDEYLEGKHGHSVAYITKKAPFPKWTTEQKKEVLYIRR